MKQIEINYLTSSGYEVLYPQTSSDLVAYNSQILTQVINQQNSEIEKLKEQVGDSAVGITIPKVVEYHFGAGTITDSTSLLVFSASTPFPVGYYYVSFIFEDLIGDIDNLMYLDSGIQGDSENIPLFYSVYKSSINYDKIIRGFFVSPALTVTSANVTLAWWAIEETAQKIFSKMRCQLKNGNYYFNNDWILTGSGDTNLSYSSLDIRIYYYD